MMQDYDEENSPTKMRPGLLPGAEWGACWTRGGSAAPSLRKAGALVQARGWAEGGGQVESSSTI